MLMLEFPIYVSEHRQYFIQNVGLLYRVAYVDMQKPEFEIKPAKGAHWRFTPQRALDDMAGMAKSGGWKLLKNQRTE